MPAPNPIAHIHSTHTHANRETDRHRFEAMRADQAGDVATAREANRRSMAAAELAHACHRAIMAELACAATAHFRSIRADG